MPLYRILGEVAEGDHLYSVKGRSPRQALRILVESGAYLEWKGFGPGSKADLLEEIADRYNPFPVVTGTNETRRMAVLVRKRLVIFEVTGGGCLP